MKHKYSFLFFLILISLIAPALALKSQDITFLTNNAYAHSCQTMNWDDTFNPSQFSLDCVYGFSDETSNTSLDYYDGVYLNTHPETSGYQFYHIFKYYINVSPTSVTSLNLTWEGKMDTTGVNCFSGCHPKIELYIFNVSSASWYKLENWADALTDVVKSYNLDSSQDYINSSKFVNFLVLANPTYYERLWTDSADLNITYDTLSLNISFPVNNSYLNYNSSVPLNFAITNDTSLDTCKYSTDNFATNTTISCGTNATFNRSNGNYLLQLWANDTINQDSTSSVNFTLDTIYPLISYGIGTALNASNLSQSNIYINTTWTEINFANITFGYWDIANASNWNTVTYSGDPTKFRNNFTGLADSNYNYNVTICDLAGNCNQTATYKITLDTTSPYFTAIPASASLTYGNNLGVDFNATDNLAFGSYASNDSRFTINQSGWLSSGVLGAATYKINITINDTSGNLNSTIYSVVINPAAGNIALLLNGTAGNINYPYGGSVNASATSSTGQTIQLLRNGVDITGENSLLNSTLIFGYYNYTANALANQNYTLATISRFVNVTLFTQTRSFNAQVNDSGGSPINLAEVQIFNQTGGQVVDVFTNSTGSISQQIITEYTDNGTNRVYRTPHTINISKAGYITNSTIVNLTATGNYTLLVTLQSTDTTAPALKIVYPTNTTYQSMTQINYTVSDANLQACWYSLNNGVANTTITCGNNVTGLSATSGSNTWKVWANDSNGNTNSSSITFGIDNTPPLITIISPINATTYTSSSRLFNITLNEAGSLCLVSLDNFTSNNTMTAVTSTNFAYTNSSIADGSYIAKFFCNDTLGNSNSTTQITFGVDTTSPSASILYPLNLYNYTAVTVMNYSSNGNRCWYSTNGGASNSTSVACGINFTITASEGLNNWTLYTNDSVGNLNKTSVYFRKDATAPTLNINFPSSVTYGTTTIHLNITTSDAGVGLSSCWFRNDTDTINHTIACNSNTTFTNVDGTHTVYVWANDTLNNVVSASKTYSILTTAPAVVLNNPANNLYLNSGKNIQINFTATSGNPLDTATLYINGVINQSVTSITSGVQKNFALLNFSDGNYNWTVKVNDTSNNNAFALNNNTFTVDTIYPLISYGIGTALNASNLSQSNIYINTTWTEINFANITFGYWDIANASNWNTVTYSGDPTKFRNNFTGLADSNYNYNVTICDLAGNCNQTATYKITLDTLLPNATLISPANNTITNTAGQNLTANVNDTNIRNGTLEIYNSSNDKIASQDFNKSSSGVIGLFYTFTDGVYSWLYKVWDWASNLFTSNSNKITIDTTLPVLTINSPLNQSYSSGAITLNLSADESLSTAYYSLNGAANTSFSNGATINVSAGSNTIIFSANDTANNWNYSSVTFYIEYSSQLDIELETLKAIPDFGANITLMATTTTNNTNVTFCNFSLQSPTANIYNNLIGTKSGNFWNSTSYVINETGVYHYNVTCMNEFNVSKGVSSSFAVSYELTYSPKNYSFAASSNSTEQNNVTIYLYDDSDSKVNYTLAVSIDQAANFTITNPGSIALNGLDSVTNQSHFIVGIQAIAGTSDGTYSGNISLTNKLNNNVSYVYFTYGINPPAGIPKFYSPLSVLCTSIFGSPCSNTLFTTTATSTTVSYKIANIGGYALTGCNINATDDLIGKISDSQGTFGLLQGEIKTDYISFSSSTVGVNYGYVYVTCNSSDSAGDTVDSSPDNRPVIQLTVAPNSNSVTPGDTGITPINTSELRQCTCGNGICEPKCTLSNIPSGFKNETYISCPVDCEGDLTPITGCFSSDPVEKSKCLFGQITGVIWIIIFIIVILIILTFFGVKKFKKSKAVAFTYQKGGKRYGTI